VLDDGFDPNQTATDYTRLISQDKVNLLLGTFSSLLNAPASAIAARQGMLYVEPSGGGRDPVHPRLHQPVLRPARHDDLRSRTGSWPGSPRCRPASGRPPPRT